MATTMQAAQARLVIVLSGLEADGHRAALVPLRYASTAAAMDVAVELHFVSACVAMLRRGAASAELLAQLRQAVELGVEIFVCPVALAQQGLQAEVLIDEVAGVRGAPSLLAAGMAPDARFMVF